jgi:hypothetical protein
MIEEIRSLSTHLHIPCTMQFDISAWVKFDGMIRMDLEKDQPVIHRESNGKTETSVATDEEVTAVFNGLKSLPLLRKEMYRYEIHGIFTENERTIIRSVAPLFVETLLMADDPVRTDRVIPFMIQLYQGGIISKERFKEITGLDP